jgi:hypothetical protein
VIFLSEVRRLFPAIFCFVFSVSVIYYVRGLCYCVFGMCWSSAVFVLVLRCRLLLRLPI